MKIRKEHRIILNRQELEYIICKGLGLKEKERENSNVYFEDEEENFETSIYNASVVIVESIEEEKVGGSNE